jgi:hypothetical protein
MVDTLTREMTEAQRLQAEARDAYRESCEAHAPLTGKKLAEQFGKSPRWGELRIQEVETEAEANSETADDEAAAAKWHLWRFLRDARKPARVPARPAPKPVRHPVERPANPQRRGASGVAWLAFGIGIIISVSANVGHIWFVTKPSDEALWSAMVFAAFWPVALAVAVEVLSRVTWPAAFRWPGLLGTVLVGGVALVVSYRHMNGLLTYFGESILSAALGPVGVDGLLIVGGFALLAIGETKKRVR